MTTANTRGTIPGEGVAAVTPNDSTDLTIIARALYVGGAGNVKINAADGSTATFVGVLAGSIIPVRAARVYSTDTTATNIVAIY